MLQIKNEQKIKKYLFVYPVLSSTNKTTDIQIRELVRNETSKNQQQYHDKYQSNQKEIIEKQLIKMILRLSFNRMI